MQADPSTFEPERRADLGTTLAAQDRVLSVGRVMAAGAASLPVVVLSGGVTALGVMRAFGRRGIETFVHPDACDYIRYSRWYRPLLDSDDRREQSDRGVLARGARSLGTGAWFPLRLQRRLEPAGRGICSNVGRRPLRQRRAAARGARHAAEQGAVRAAAAAARRADAEDAAHQRRRGHPRPAAVRRHVLSSSSRPTPRASSSVSAPRACACAPRTKPGGASTKSTAAGMSVVLQEYIPGPFSDHYFIDGYVDRRGAIQALFPRRRLRIYPPDFGNSTSMVSVALADVDGAVDTVRRVLARRELSRHLLRRVQARRARRTVQAARGQRAPLVVHRLRRALRRGRLPHGVRRRALAASVPPLEQYRIGATCIYPYYDFFAMQPLVRAGRARPGAAGPRSSCARCSRSAAGTTRCRASSASPRSLDRRARAIVLTRRHA